jgi:hypothetical protein
LATVLARTGVAEPYAGTAGDIGGSELGRTTDGVAPAGDIAAAGQRWFACGSRGAGVVPVVTWLTGAGDGIGGDVSADGGETLPDHGCGPLPSRPGDASGGSCDPS